MTGARERFLVAGDLRMTKLNESFGYEPDADDASISGSSVGWGGAREEPAPLHVITLASSVAPLSLRAPTSPQLAGLAVFRSRSVEDGRERFRVHIGYFASAAEAEKVLPIVRESYPAAIVSVAPQSSMGSLDDTAMARFSILRPAEKPAAQPVVAPARTAAAVSLAPPPATRAAVAPPRPVARPVAAPPRAVPKAAPAPGVHSASLLDGPMSEAFSESTQVPPVLNAADAVAAQPLAELGAREAQHYAVQLIWSRGAIDLNAIPVLAIFSGYLLYAVETEPGARRFFGVRLGFYADALSARLVAQYVRSEFKGVAVVPVSQREMTRASTAAIRLSAARRSSGTRTRWPSSALSVDTSNLVRAFTPGMN
jgi:hypothetical protein